MDGPDPRDVLAVNLDALMRRPGRPAIKERELANKAKARGHEISQSSINRVLNKKVACTVDHLAILARLFNLEPWQLLVPNLNPADPPVLASISRQLEQFQATLKQQSDTIAAMREQLERPIDRR